jgi:PAS domain S-box-containing protein
MMNHGQYKIKSGRLELYMVLAGVFWTLVVGASFVWNEVEENLEAEQIARTYARTTIEMDVSSRRWATMQGEVYVSITEKTQPNPYLEGPERKIKTPSGKELTLMSPHHMMRQIHELRRHESGVQGHMTSLKPTNPQNVPDPWEEKALKLLEGRTVSEVSSIELIQGKPYMRMMHVLPIEQSCLKCHAKQGFKTGDIRGGISAAVPMEPLLSIARSHKISIAAWHGIIWLLVLGGIGAVTLHLKRRIAEQRQAEEALRESEQRYRSLFDRIPIGLYQTTPQGQIIDANPALVKMLGYPDRMSLHALNAADTYVNSEARTRWQSIMGREGVVLNYQKELRRFDGAITWVNENTRVIRDNEGHVLFYEGSFQDITERKRIEEEREKLIRELQEALAKVKKLSGFLPICASCKKIRDDKGYWNQIEEYIRDHSEAEFSHGICPECMKKLYPDL